MCRPELTHLCRAANVRWESISLQQLLIMFPWESQQLLPQYRLTFDGATTLNLEVNLPNGEIYFFPKGH